MTTEYQNLVGVFARCFPIVCALIKGKPGQSQMVTYYGQCFTIVGTESGFTVTGAAE